MRIKDVRAIPLELRLEKPFSGGTYVVRNRNTIVTVVETTDGVRGETYGGDEDMDQAAVVNLVNGVFRDKLLDREIPDPDAVRGAYRELMDLPVDLGFRALVDLDMGRHGIHQQALSALDVALWDALGKSLGRPVHALLGGARRERIPVIAIGGYYHPDDPEGTAREAAGLAGLGLSGMKMKVGRAPYAQDVERIEAAKAAGGAGFAVAVDVNQGWSVEQSLDFCSRAAGLGLAWLEEPVKWYDCLSGLARVRAASSIPIVSGQGDISEFRSKDLVRFGAVDQLNTDATLVGGVTGWMNVAAFAAEHGVAMGHHEEPQVALTLLAVVEKIGPVEIFANPDRDPLWQKIVRNPPRPEAGFLAVPQGPGLGLALDWGVIGQYAQA